MHCGTRSAHEAELLRKMEQRRAMLEQHQGVARSAAEEAEMERARHQEHLQGIHAAQGVSILVSKTTKFCWQG